MSAGDAITVADDPDVCDPGSAVAGRLDAMDLQAGVTIRRRVCPRFWLWMRVPTLLLSTVLETTRQLDAAGVTRAVETHQSVNASATAVVEFDVDFNESLRRYTTSDVLLSDGVEPLPPLWQFPFNFRPEDPGQLAQSDFPQRLRWLPQRDTVTETVTSYASSTAALLGDSSGCGVPNGEHAYIGVRCALPDDSLVPCAFNLTVHLVPRELSDGVSFDAPIAKSSRHLFGFRVGPFDAYTLSVSTLDEAPYQGLQDTPQVFALRGELISTRGACPSGSGDASDHADVAKAVIETPGATLERVCTGEDEAGFYGIGLISADQIGPFSMPYTPTAIGATCENGYVAPDGRPATSSLNCNPNSELNELKESRGRYRLEVRHKHFSQGALSAHEVRRGCLSFGQWRRYTIYSSGISEANLFVQMPVSLGAVLIRANSPPTLDAYDRYMTSPGNASLSPCELAGKSRTSLTRVSHKSRTSLAQVSHKSRTSLTAHFFLPTWPISFPPHMSPDSSSLNSHLLTQLLTQLVTQTTEPRVWHLALYMPELNGSFGGSLALNTTPGEFELSARLADARIPIGSYTLAHADGGDGHVCCREMQYFAVNVSSALLSLRAELNVSRGRLKALFVKAGACPRDPEDVDGSTCTGKCVMSWLARYDRYNGALTYADTASAVVPHGVNAEDKRSTGLWYVGVEAMDESAAEFSLSIDANEYGSAAEVQAADRLRCDRYDGQFDCASSVWMVPELPGTDVHHESSAASTRVAALGGILGGSRALNCCLLLLWGGALSVTQWRAGTRNAKDM